MAALDGYRGERGDSTSVGSFQSGRQRDQYEDVFVDSLPDYLKCPICLCCLSNPYQVSSNFLPEFRHRHVDYFDRLLVVTDFARIVSCPFCEVVTTCVPLTALQLTSITPFLIMQWNCKLMAWKYVAQWRDVTGLGKCQTKWIIFPSASTCVCHVTSVGSWFSRATLKNMSRSVHSAKYVLCI